MTNIFNTIAKTLNDNGIAVIAVADKRVAEKQSAFEVAKQKVLDKLAYSIKCADGEGELRKASFTDKDGIAYVGVKYSNAYLAVEGVRWFEVEATPESIKAILNVLVQTVEQGAFDEALAKAVAVEQVRSVERYEKRKAKAAANDAATTKASSLVSNTPTGEIDVSGIVAEMNKAA
jgi:hypothetical protein